MDWKEISEMSKQFVQKELYNENNKPFTICSDCKNNLDAGYRIFKSYSRLNLDENHKLILELALCENCFENYSSEVSKETSDKLEELRKEYPDIGVTTIEIDYLFGNDSTKTELHCQYTKKTHQELYEYQVSALCYKDKQITKLSVLGDEVLKAYEECISDETQGYIDDFINRIIDLPPEIQDLIKGRTFKLV